MKIVPDIDAVDLVTMKGFTSNFWQVYGSGRYKNQEQAYEALEGIYFERFGEHRFPSFDAFRMRRDRKHK